ncbi:MAG TPA: UDP-N-acetylmuramoyl-L-alanine--D-glutamate ligase [Acidimicrobiales bacterium]|nr:UDP-N-acetylmuramoyl-L-alanine--D-glutamate ligase [Acidimicrobiales bacterium]
MTLDDLSRRRVAVWGMGREGLAMARLLIERGSSPLLIDDQVEGAAGRVEAELSTDLPVLAPDRVEWGGLDVVIRSPGVSRYRDELAAAESAGVTVTTATAVWLEDFHRLPVLAITGTKGKSTTAALAASILEHLGLSVALVGNIGDPVTDLYRRDPVDAYVVEVSSYQAADVTVSPGVCVLTSLAPDHLDWHGGVETYYRDKLRLIDAGPPGLLAVNAASAEAVRRTADHPHRTLFGVEGRVRVEPSGMISVDGTPVVAADRLPVPGGHNVANLCGAIAGVLLLRGESPSVEAVTAAVDGYGGLPSRCRTVGERAGLTFVDDALASNPFATSASVAAFPGRDLTVILGGADRGVDLGELSALLVTRRPRPKVVVLPPDPERMVEALRDAGSDSGPSLSVQTAGDLEEAVAMAMAVTPVDGVVLFSPAAPTPGGEGGYRQRSRQFISAVGLPGDADTA